MKSLGYLFIITSSNSTKFFKFEPKKLHANSKIKADYLAKGFLPDSTTAFVFFLQEKDNGFYIPNSMFSFKGLDYSSNQTSYTTVLKEKINLTTQETKTIFTLKSN